MLNSQTIRTVLSHALSRGAAFAEIYMEDSEESSMEYAGALSGLTRLRTFGVGINLIADKRNAYVYTNEQTRHALLSAVDRAAEILGLAGGGSGKPAKRRSLAIENPCPVLTYPSSVTNSLKIGLLKEADTAARAVTPSLRSLQLTYFDRDQRVRIVNTEGTDAEDRRVTVRLRYIPLIENEHGSISRYGDYSAAAGYEALSGGVYIPSMERHIRDMESGLSADEAPSAKVPVILDGGSCTGVFFHEACGHQLETDMLKQGGMFWDKRGRRIASEKVTLIDDGTMPGMYGSARIDDEGIPRQKNVLIENGILKSFMADRLGALQLGLQPTGSGRRQDYKHAAAARMSNTYLAAGDDDEDEIIRSTPKGLLVTAIGGGTGGREFTLMAETAFWIRNGQIDRQVKGAMLLGRGDETMLKIDRVGKTMVAQDGGGSFCGASSGFCANTANGPRMRISEMLVGGKGGK
ncbi:MAG: TldD/PmbA family protein [Clostridiales bacterium]|nr:TldD/PmbA family protein [Clostridiales bacterium]